MSLNLPPTSAEFYAMALHHKQKTLNCLRRELASLDKGSSDHILVSMLMLCLFDVGLSKTQQQYLDQSTANIIL